METEILRSVIDQLGLESAKEENLDATDLPIDSPSPKMLAFMRKHFNQTHPLRQSNGFVIFPAFFQHVNRFFVPRRNAQSIAPNEELLTGLSNSISFGQNSSNKSSLDNNPTKSKKENVLIDTRKGIGPLGHINFYQTKSVQKLDFDPCTSSKSDLDNSMQLRNRQEGRSSPAAQLQLHQIHCKINRLFLIQKSILCCDDMSANQGMTTRRPRGPIIDIHGCGEISIITYNDPLYFFVIDNKEVGNGESDKPIFAYTNMSCKEKS
ncbi:hypothetical protein ACTXT7_002115 [Hymenolepis weldensis]